MPYDEPTPNIDIDWILEAEITVTHLGPYYVVQEVEGDGRQCVMTWGPEDENGHAWLLFDGKKIETEAFYGYLGLLDQVNEETPRTPVHFDKEN